MGSKLINSYWEYDYTYAGVNPIVPRDTHKPIRIWGFNVVAFVFLLSIFCEHILLRILSIYVHAAFILFTSHSVTYYETMYTWQPVSSYTALYGAHKCCNIMGTRNILTSNSLSMG